MENSGYEEWSEGVSEERLQPAISLANKDSG